MAVFLRGVYQVRHVRRSGCIFAAFRRNLTQVLSSQSFVGYNSTSTKLKLSSELFKEDTLSTSYKRQVYRRYLYVLIYHFRWALDRSGAFGT